MNATRLLFALLINPVLVAALSGCVTKAKAREQARAAYLTGQREAMLKVEQRGPTVIVSGSVRTPFVPWTPDLTLAKAIVLANYYGPDPRLIIMIRNGEQTTIPPAQLLSGEDIPLQAGDIVKIDPQAKDELKH